MNLFFLLSIHHNLLSMHNPNSTPFPGRGVSRWGGRALRRFGFSFGLSLLAGVAAHAQTASTYRFSASTGTFTPITGGTAVNSILSDDVASGLISLPFSFRFEGTDYTSFWVSSNGLLGFGSTPSTRLNNDFTLNTLSGSNLPVLAPFWDDLTGGTPGASAKYVVTGTAPNRVLTMEWLHFGAIVNPNPTYEDVLSFQVKLYEGSNRIEYVYRPEPTFAATTATIGMKGVGEDFQSLRNSTVATTSTSNVSNNSLTRPLSGVTFAFVPGNFWTGVVSTAWTAPGNWSEGAAPTATGNASIGAAPNQPVVSGFQSVANISVTNGGRLTLAAGANLAVSGAVSLLSGSALAQQANSQLTIGPNLLNNGATFALDRASRISFLSGAGAVHSITGSGVTAFQNLGLGEQFANTQLNIQNTTRATVQGVLLMGASSSINLNNGGLTLVSDANATGQIVKDAASAVNGTVTVQRAITPTSNPGVGYRHYSSPVVGATMSSLATAGFTPTFNPAYNTSPTPNLVVPFPTVFGYDQARVGTVTSTYSPFDQGFYSPSANDPMVLGRGYTVNIPASAVVSFTGALVNADFSLPGLTRGSDAQSGWQLVGNPYASVIDMAVVMPASTGLDGAAYVYQSTGQYVGTYQPYVNGVGTGQYVAPAQGFFVRTASSAVPGVLNVPNAARSANTTATMQRTAVDTRPQVHLDLVSAATQQRDAAYVYFETGASAAFDKNFDAAKLPAAGVPYLAVAASAEPLAVSGLAPLGTADVVLPLTVGVPSTGTYTLEAAQLLNLPVGKFAYLRDAQTGAVVDLAQQPSYRFAMNAAFTGPRFSLLFTGNRVLASAPASLSAQVAVYPNPARGQVLVEVPAALRQQALALTLVNALGQTVKTATLPADSQARALPLAGVAAGVYSLRLATPKGLVTKHLVVE